MLCRICRVCVKVGVKVFVRVVRIVGVLSRYLGYNKFYIAVDS